MEKVEIRQRLLISIQRALLGMVYPELRGILVDFGETKTLKVSYYLDREPTEFDYENISCVTGEILADIEFQEVEEVCKFIQGSLNSINDTGIWVYRRFEGNGIKSVVG